MSAPSAEAIRRPWLACALQLAFLGAPVGGLGYLLRREWAPFLRTAAAVGGLDLVVLAASAADIKVLSALTMPLIFSVQVLSALDLYRRGRR